MISLSHEARGSIHPTTDSASKPSNRTNLDKLVLASDVSKTREADLCDDGAELSRGGRDSVAGGTVTSGEDLSGDDEGGTVARGKQQIVSPVVWEVSRSGG